MSSSYTCKHNFITAGLKFLFPEEEWPRIETVRIDSKAGLLAGTDTRSLLMSAHAKIKLFV